jgi:cytochrome c556
LKLRDQLNFYFSDSNLLRDKFLRQKLSENTQLPLTLFLSFNQVKKLLLSEAEEKDRLERMRQAVAKSNMLKLSKCGKLVKRRLPFDAKSVDQKKMDSCTIYVENFPENLSQ